MDNSKALEMMKGKIFTNVDIINNEEIIFISNDGHTFRMFHEQECCEDVRIEDVCGNIKNLIGYPISFAEETSNEGEGGQAVEEWTFYKFATVLGWVDIRWYGTSNGCYATHVSIEVSNGI